MKLLGASFRQFSSGTKNKKELMIFADNTQLGGLGELGIAERKNTVFESCISRPGVRSSKSLARTKAPSTLIN